MFLLFSFLSFSQNLPLALSRSFSPVSVQTEFSSRANVFLVGFSKEISEPLSLLLQSTVHSLYKTNVVNTVPEVHHAFTASVEHLNIEINDDANPELIIKSHFSKANTKLAIYCILTKNFTDSRKSKILLEEDDFIAIMFNKKALNADAQKNAYLVADVITQKLSDIFNFPLSSMPLANFTHPTINIFLVAKNESTAKKYQKIIEDSTKDFITPGIFPVSYDSGIDLVCGFCEDSECVANWLMRSPEYYASVIIGNQLAVFVLPKKCPPSFRYGDDKIAFAPESDRDGVKDAVKSSLLGIRPLRYVNSFENIMVRRNLVVMPLLTLVKNITTVIEGVREIHNLGLEYTDQDTLNILDKYVSDFKDKQEQITADALDGLDINQTYGELQKIVDDAWFVWSRISENVRMKRICVVNHIDISKDPFFLKRPSVLAAISVVTSIILLAYTFSRMRAKTVVTIISQPSPLL